MAARGTSRQSLSPRRNGVIQANRLAKRLARIALPSETIAEWKGSKPTKRRRLNQVMDTKPELKCPSCGVQIRRSMSARDFELCRHFMDPQLGDLTSCDYCDLTLEDAGDSTNLHLTMAPKSRINVLKRVEPLQNNCTLPQLL